ncbi:MAG: hypothetical protein MJ237_07490 [bacterium]|nr:hypothetical protein [bacterium]
MGKKSSKTTSKTVYGNTTTSNPYVVSKTSNNGTETAFAKNSAFESINNFLNNNIDNMLEEYLNPTLNSSTNKAKMNSFTNALTSATSKNLENDIINPLSNRNMIRSSQATDLYRNLLKNNSNAVSNYANELIANNQKDMNSLLTSLLAAYMSGYTALSDTQSQSLLTSQGNSTKTNKTTNNTGDISPMTNLAMSMALLAAGL